MLLPILIISLLKLYYSLFVPAAYVEAVPRKIMPKRRAVSLLDTPLDSFHYLLAQGFRVSIHVLTLRYRSTILQAAVGDRTGAKRVSENTPCRKLGE
jgi:hypothetical protein